MHDALCFLPGFLSAASALKQSPLSLHRGLDANFRTLEAFDHLDETRFLTEIPFEAKPPSRKSEQEQASERILTEIPFEAKQPSQKSEQEQASERILTKIPFEAKKPSRKSKQERAPERKCSDHVARRRELALKGSNVTDEEVMKYAQQYKSSFKSRTMVYFLHLSKCAGSLMCVAAVDAGCNASLWNGGTKNMANCFSDGPGTPHDGSRWGTHDWWAISSARPSHFNVCKNLREYYVTNGLTFTANENTLPLEGPCPEFWNVISLRNPVNRIISHMSNLHDIPEHRRDFSPDRVTPELALLKAPRITNNYYARSLLGQEVYDMQAGRFNESHFEQAKEKLGSFDSIFLQDGDITTHINDELGFHFANETIHWDPFTGRNNDEYSRRLEGHWTSSEWDRLKRANWLDLKLFQHARYLRELDAIILQHPVFLRELSKQDKKPCPCGHLCK